MTGKVDSAWLSQRRRIIIAFWSTIVLGIPIWYLTTRVSRATLPIIPDFVSPRPTVVIDVQGLQPFSAHKIAIGLNLLQDCHHFLNSTSKTGYAIEFVPSDTFSTYIESDTRKWIIKASEEQSQNVDESIMANLMNIFSDECQRIESIVTSVQRPSSVKVVKYSPVYNLVFSLLNGGGKRAMQHWPIAQSLEKNLDPILAEFTQMAHFDVESQLQLHADLTFTPTFDEQTGDHVLQLSDLKNFINSAEWNLATAQSQSKPLNFIIYVPKPEHRPLVIRQGTQTSPTNSFVLPQFGSIIIYNPPADSTSDTLQDDVMDTIIKICTSHLLELLGLPETPPSLGNASKWRRDGLLRQRYVETMHSAQETLKSIPKIIDQIPNMHVPAHVSSLVQEALSALSAAEDLMASGNLELALEQSRLALKHAEEAFFDDKMISLLYFPDEHKYGVYMPLFGPLFLPLVMAAIRELKAYSKDRKARRSRKVSHEHKE